MTFKHVPINVTSLPLRSESCFTLFRSKIHSDRSYCPFLTQVTPNFQSSHNTSFIRLKNRIFSKAYFFPLKMEKTWWYENFTHLQYLAIPLSLQSFQLLLDECEVPPEQFASHHRATQTPEGHQLTYEACCWTVVGSRSARRKHTYIRVNM